MEADAQPPRSGSKQLSLTDLFTAFTIRGGAETKRTPAARTAHASTARPQPSQWCFPPSTVKISSLPPELLVRILCTLEGHVPTLAAAACVCRQWRHVVNKSPRLWRHIDVGLPCAGQERTRAAAMLTCELLGGIVAIAGPQLTHLRLHGCHQLDENALRELLFSKCVNLEVLDLTGCKGMFYEDVAQILRILEPPNLKVVRLSGVRFTNLGRALPWNLLLTGALPLIHGLPHVRDMALDVNNACLGCNTLGRRIKAPKEGEEWNTWSRPNGHHARRCSVCHLDCCSHCVRERIEQNGMPADGFSSLDAMSRHTCCCGHSFVCPGCIPSRAALAEVVGPTACRDCNHFFCRNCRPEKCSTQTWQGRPRCLQSVCRPCASKHGPAAHCASCGDAFCSVCANHYGMLSEVDDSDGPIQLCSTCMQLDRA